MKYLRLVYNALQRFARMTAASGTLALISTAAGHMDEMLFRRPLVGMAVAFMSGIYFAEQAWIPRQLLMLAMLSLLTGMAITVKRRGWFSIFCLAAVFLLGVCRMDAARSYPPTHITNLVGRHAEMMRIRGVVSSDPVQKKNKTIFTLRRLQIYAPEKVPRVAGAVLVYNYLPLAVARGDLVEFQGRVGRPVNLRIGKRFFYRDYLRQRGVYAQAWISSRGSIRVLGAARNTWGERFGAESRRRARNIMQTFLSPVSADVLSAMLLGARGEVPPFINRALQRSGTVHILAVSGLHVGIVAALLLGVLRLVPMNYRLRHGAAIVCLIGYCLFAGARVSIVRATLMGITALAAPLLGRDYDAPSALALAALFIVGVNPWQLADVGFGLSFVTVFFLLVGVPLVWGFWPRQRRIHSGVRCAVQAITVSSVAWLGSAGLVSYYFGMVTPIAVIANVLIIPLLGLMVISGMLLLISGAVFLPLAPGMAVTVELLLGVLYRINSALIALPGAYREHAYLSASQTAGYYGLLLLLLAGAAAMLHRRRRRMRAGVFLLSVRRSKGNESAGGE